MSKILGERESKMLPIEFLERMEKMLGNDYRAFLESYDKEEYKALRFNPLRGKQEDFDRNNSFHLNSVPWEENGYYYEEEDKPGKHPYHEAGVYYIQEPSAMAPVHFLNPRPGETILDLCAAPGGKSTQIGSKMNGQGLLLTNEIHPQRAKILSENIERMGISNAIVCNETPQRLADRFEAFFDKILVDAPCSGEGMFRKNDDARNEWSPANVELCAKRQDEILECAANMLKSGGTIVFSTCTFSEEENEGSIRRFLESHPEFEVQNVPLYDGMEQSEWGIRLWPHKIKGEGHFLSVLKKEGTLETGDWICYELQKGQSIKQYNEFLEFCMENGLDKYEKTDFMGGTYIVFGEQLYLLPKDAPKLDKMKVLRPGLHVATIKKGRIEPAHALSHILTQNDFKNVISLRGDSLEVRQYLNGQTLNAEGNKGWNLVCVDSYGLGFGKLSGGILKNHYPKGLRSLHL